MLRAFKRSVVLSHLRIVLEILLMITLLLDVECTVKIGRFIHLLDIRLPVLVARTVHAGVVLVERERLHELFVILKDM